MGNPPRIRPLRTDAQANRDFIIDAARRAFIEQRNLGNIAQVASKAGLSRATVYRHFPTLEDLMFAVAEQQLHEVRSLGDSYLAMDSGNGRMLMPYVFGAFDYCRNNPLFLEWFRGARPSRIIKQHEMAREPVARLLDRARKAGLVSRDVQEEELYILLNGTVTQLTAEPGLSGTLWRRSAWFILHAIDASPVAVDEAMRYDIDP
jgi:AcrR family transcriptional regulator